MLHVRSIVRRAPALALAASLLVSALGAPASSVAAADPPGPAARLQVVVKEVKIHDDRENSLLGNGDFTLYAGIWRCKEDVPAPCFNESFRGGGPNWPPGVETVAQYMPSGSISGAAWPVSRMSHGEFHGTTGETIPLNRVFPRTGDETWDGDSSPELGFAVFDGERYVLQFHMWEYDSALSDIDTMGYTLHLLDTEEHGLGLGTHTLRSTVDKGPRPGDYSVTYEIRRMQLPDLRPISISAEDLPNSSKKHVCSAVQNVMTADAGPFLISFSADGVALPGGETFLPGLASADSSKLCVDTDIPPGPHLLRAVVDGPHRVVEFNEANNAIEQAYYPPAQVGPAAPEQKSSDKPEATSNGARADLSIRAIKVNGQVPDGKDDCKTGKNTLIVVVKNAGSSAASDFDVRLQVGPTPAESIAASVADLKAGQEREIRFDATQLHKGANTLAAFADAQEAVDETTEGNNELTVSAQCKDAA